MTSPMPSTVPATANGEVATISISADSRERWRADDIADRNADQRRAAGRQRRQQQRVGERPVRALEQLREIVESKGRNAAPAR